MRLIDADALCKHLHELKTGDKDTVYEYYDDGIDTAISEAATFPTIEAEPVKHGHWVDDGLYADNHLFHVWRCSKCDKNMMVKDSSQEAGAPWFKYCPNCGAKMDEVNE